MPSRLLLLILVTLAPLGAQEPAYRILVTSGHGVHAQGLAAVAQVLQAIGQVVIVAPSMDHVTLNRAVVSGDPVYRDDLTLPNGLRAVGLTATPARSVAIAMERLLTPRPDLVVVGLDRGDTLGLSDDPRGTMAAAREAATYGVPAIAALLTEEASATDVVFASEEVLGVARRVKQYGLPQATYLNVNIPKMPTAGYAGYRITTPAARTGGEMRVEEGRHPSGRVIYWTLPGEAQAARVGTDRRAVADGHVSVTPMTLDATDASQLGALRAIFE